MNRKKAIFVLVGICLLAVVIVCFFIVKPIIKKDALESSDIAYFEYGFGDSSTGYKEYKIMNDEEEISMSISKFIYEEETYDITEETLNDLEELIIEQQIYKWDGFHKKDSALYEISYDFHLKIEYQNGETIDASGYMIFPKDYHLFNEAVEEILNP